MKKIQDIFSSIVNKVENNSTPFKRYIFLFFAILLIRLSLEFFSSNRLFTFYDIIHIGLWFIFIVTSFLLQLHLFSGESIIKISKLVITFFTIALSAPIIDLIISGGKGAKMNYLSINSVNDIVWSYFTIGGSSITRGATMGIRIEIIILVIVCFNYVYTKQKSVIKGIVAAFSIYTVLFLSGIMPFILGIIVNYFKLQYQANDQSTILFLLVLDVFLFFLIILRYSVLKIKTIFKKTPIYSIIMGVICFFLGIFLARKNYPNNWSLNPTALFWFPILVALLFCFCIYTSVLQIKKNDNEFSQHYYLENGLLLLMLVLGVSISTFTLFSVALLWGVLFMLNEKPLLLCDFSILNNLGFALTQLCASLIGFTTFGGPMISFPIKWIVIIILSGFSMSLARNKFKWSII